MREKFRAVKFVAYMWGVMYIAVFGTGLRLDLSRPGLRSLHPPPAFVAVTALRLQRISIMSAGSSNQVEKKGHICLVGDAKHPSERWETRLCIRFHHEIHKPAAES